MPKNGGGRMFSAFALIISLIAIALSIYTEEINDNISPVVGIIDPDYNQTVSGNMTIRSKIWETSDYNVSVLINGTKIGDSELVQINTSIFTNGNYNLTVLAKDSFGNIGSDEIPIFINNTCVPEMDRDNDDPIVRIINPDYNDQVNGNITIRALVIEDSDFEISILLDDVEIGRHNNLEINTSMFMDGWHNVTFNVTDVEGNTGLDRIPILINNTIDGISESEDKDPIVCIISPDYGDILDGNITIRAFVFDDSDYNTSVYINETKISESIPTIWNSSGEDFGNGWWRITVNVTDKYNNTGQDNILVYVNNEASISGERIWYLNTSAIYYAVEDTWTTIGQMKIDFDTAEGELLYLLFNCRATIWDNSIKIRYIIDGTPVIYPFAHAETIDTFEFSTVTLQHALSLDAGTHNATIQIFKEYSGTSSISYCTLFIKAYS